MEALLLAATHFSATGIVESITGLAVVAVLVLHFIVAP